MGMEENPAVPQGLAGLRVLSLESRRAAEMTKLLANYGADPIVAPSMQEVPLASNTEALAFARTLVDGGFDAVIFLTGTGTRTLVRVMETSYTREQIVTALSRLTIIARGPKPGAVLKELGVPVTITVPEPNTWRELLHAVDQQSAIVPVQGRRIAVQEYGAPNSELLAALTERGAAVTRVPVYEWALPDDTGPLRAAVESISRAEIDVAIFTTSMQVIHLLWIAAEMKLDEAVLRGLAGMVVGSIGPMTSDTLRQQGIEVDFEPAHPKMGFLVAEAVQKARAVLTMKRARGSGLVPAG
jgi:uroporphyrinogen-III synthase